MSKSLIHRTWTQAPFFAWLIILWMLLWGQFTWLAFVTGLMVAVVVTVVFRLPTAELTGRFNVFWFLTFGVTFLWALVMGALQVSWQTISPRKSHSSIVRAPLRIDDDFIMTQTAVTMSLVPGSTVLEADRGNRVLYLHVLGAETPEDVEKARQEALVWEKRIVRAFGSRGALETVRLGAAPFEERRAIREGGAA